MVAGLFQILLQGFMDTSVGKYPCTKIELGFEVFF